MSINEEGESKSNIAHVFIALPEVHSINKLYPLYFFPKENLSLMQIS
jgi:hypothetical protein